MCVVLTCIAKGENISLTWKFNNVEIKINSLTKLSKNNSQLKIEEVKSAQSGRYRCIATNHFGSSFGQIDVRVHSMFFVFLFFCLNFNNKMFFY